MALVSVRSYAGVTAARTRQDVYDGRVPHIKTDCSGCGHCCYAVAITDQTAWKDVAKLYKSESVDICLNFDKPRLRCPS